MRVRSLLVVALTLAPGPTNPASAEEQGPRVIVFHGYVHAIELRRGPARAVLCPQAGGRVLEFSVDGKNALFLDESENHGRPGMPGPITAGRFDFGPELTVVAHPSIWSGEWTVNPIEADAVVLTSPRDESAGFQLAREFRFIQHESSVGLACKQTITNISTEVRDVCHWGRSFSPGGGVCVIPLGDFPSRFPSRYAMYEDSAVINVRATDEQIRVRDGFLEILGPPRKPKLGFDTYAGWLGYALPNDGLFVKRFKTYPDRVYNEAAGLTLSVWYPPGPRVELEPIGPRERLQPGASASFTEEWWLLSHPFPKPGERLDLKALADQVARQTAEPK